jgi:4-hydroxy-tetrahydrodipicolinate reductase
MIRVGVLGGGGRMGSTVCGAVSDAPDLELVAAVDPHHAGIDLRQIGIRGPGLVMAGRREALLDAGAQVAVDFTELAAARENLRWCAERGIHAVVGTTGFTPADIEEITGLFDASPANAVIAPNFAVGAVLMMRFAELAAPFFETVEVIELHHDAKVDAPSGTAVTTAERIAAASPTWAPDPTTTWTLDAARGAEGPAGIRVHSVRLRGLVAHQEVLFGTDGQTLTLRHDSLDRSSFMPGVLMAIRAVVDRPGLTLGLDSLLGV